MQNCWKNIKKFSISLFYFYLFFTTFFNKQSFSNENKDTNSNTNKTMFSSRIANTNDLFIIDNNQAIIRTIKNKKFNYQAPDDICYNLENGANVCIVDGKIDKITGTNFSVSNEDIIAKIKYRDEFFIENNKECNEMKFNLVNTIFVNHQTINGFQTQLYLPDYYNVIKLILFKPLEDDITNIDNQKEENTIYAFIFSQNYDIGCSHFADYKVFHNPKEVQEGIKKKKKNKKIVAKNQQELLKKISTESYKKMLLKDYVYLHPANDNDEVIKIILSIYKNKVTQVNDVAINMQLSQIGEKELLSFPAKESEEKISKKNSKK